MVFLVCHENRHPIGVGIMKWKHILFIILIASMIVLFPYLYDKQFGAVGCLFFSFLFFLLAYREWKSSTKKKQYKD